MSRDVVIRIKVGEDLPEEIRDLVNILDESHKPGWQLKIPGWRIGQRSLSERAISLMLDSIRVRSSTKAAEVAENQEIKSKTKPVASEDGNPFG